MRPNTSPSSLKCCPQSICSQQKEKSPKCVFCVLCVAGCLSLGMGSIRFQVALAQDPYGNSIYKDFCAKYDHLSNYRGLQVGKLCGKLTPAFCKEGGVLTGHGGLYPIRRLVTLDLRSRWQQAATDRVSSGSPALCGPPATAPGSHRRGQQ